MVYHSFDRQILVATESTEGTAASLSASNYVDCLTDVDVDFTVIKHDRDLVRSGWTEVPDFFASSGVTSGSMVATATINFTVELSLKTGATPVSTAPGWAPLFKACGMEQIDSIVRIGTGAISSGPILHREGLEVTSVQEGRALGTHFDGDSFVYYNVTGTSITATDSVAGQVSGAGFTASGTETDVGIAFVPNSTKGSGNSSSCTIQLYWAGRLYKFVGCRGSVSMTFASTNRVLMAFTMQGIMDSVTNGSRQGSITYGHALPSVFTAASLKLNEHASSTAFTGALFSQLAWDLGNEVVFREDANSASGFKAAQIVGRAGQVTLDPDAVLGGATAASKLDFFSLLAQGTVCRAEWTVGSGMDAASALFRMPALQFDDIGMTDREKIEVFDLTAMVTGGLYGDSVESADGTARDYADRGRDNEFSIVLY